MILHILHGDSAPHTNHKRFNLALVCPASDAKVAVLSPVLSPGVGSNLERISRQSLSKYLHEKVLICKN